MARLKGVDIDGKRIVTSDQAIALDKVPQRLLVIGAGVIGLELGSVWRRLGSQVTVVEFLDRILPGMDNEVGRQSQRLLEKQGIAFKLGSKVTGVDSSGATLKAKIEPAKGGAAETIEADVVLVAIGRVPYTEGLGLDEAGVKKDNRGRVIVDAHFATNVKGIYAIGDVIAGPMLAHKAEDEGVAVAEILAGQAGHVNYDVIPNVVYTFPEIASVGKTEEELKEAGIAYNAGKFPFTANGRAKANHQTDGFVKILADAKTDRVLGVHIVGSDAGNMIAEAAVAMEFGAAAEDIARTCHAHPTLPEAVKEAALAVAKRAIHMWQRMLAASSEEPQRSAASRSMTACDAPPSRRGLHGPLAQDEAEMEGRTTHGQRPQGQSRRHHRRGERHRPGVRQAARRGRRAHRHRRYRAGRCRP